MGVQEVLLRLYYGSIKGTDTPRVQPGGAMPWHAMGATGGPRPPQPPGYFNIEP